MSGQIKPVWDLVAFDEDGSGWWESELVATFDTEDEAMSYVIAAMYNPSNYVPRCYRGPFHKKSLLAFSMFARIEERDRAIPRNPPIDWN